MLPDATPQGPASLMMLLASFGSLFTAPSFRTFCDLACGFLAQAGRRTVCGMLAGAGLSRYWPHDRAHQLFSRARWNADDVGLAVAKLALATFPRKRLVRDFTSRSRGDGCAALTARLRRRNTARGIRRAGRSRTRLARPGTMVPLPWQAVYMTEDKPEPHAMEKVTAAMDEFMATVLRHLRTGQGSPLEELGLERSREELQHWRPDIPGAGIEPGQT